MQHSTKDIIIFVVIMTSVVALILSGMATMLKDVHQRNELIYNKRAILSSVSMYLPKDIEEMTDKEIQEIFNSRIDQYVLNARGEEVSRDAIVSRGYSGGLAESIDMARERKRPESDRFFPLFVYNADNGEEYYILQVRGNGLWDEIWGSVALEDDLETVTGAAFDHQAETPGLGAEIKDNPSFSRQFQGKKIYNEQGDYTGIKVRKGGAQNDRYEVDGISGATVTSDGVSEMLYRGINYYRPYFISLDKKNDG